MKKLVYLLFLLFSEATFAQKLAVPLYTAGQIKFYDVNAAPATLLGTFNVSVSGVTYNPNGVSFYGNDLFVTYDAPSSDGFLHFKGVSVSGGTVTVTSGTKITTGTITTEIVVDAIGNLFVGCGFGVNRGVKKYVRDGSGNYSFDSNLAVPAVINDQWYNGIGGLTLDASGNLWGTDLGDNRILKWTNATGSPSQFSCTASSSFCQTQFQNTASQSVYPLSLPEGLVFDASGNLWVANNNDGWGPNTNASGGSLLKLNASYLAAGGNFVQSDISIYSTASSKFGGMTKSGSEYYVNDQGNGKVWRINTSTGVLTDMSIAATYPGNGQVADVPCQVFAAPANPTAANASPATINSGQTSTLLASGCAANTTYKWKQGTSIVATTASFTSPPLSSTSTYTVHCANGACESTGLSVIITVNAGGGTTPQIASISVTSALQTNNPRIRTFTYKLPAASTDCNRPLMIALHGDGGTGEGLMTDIGMNAIAEANNFIVVYPNALTVAGGVQWNKFADAVAGSGDNGNDLNAPDDEKFISDIIDYFFTNYGIDRSKVYVTGHSGGGYMAYALAISNQTKNKIAAIAPVAASLWGANSYLTTQFGAGVFVPTPLLHLHSTTDGVVSFPTLNSWTWPMASFSNATCSNASYTTTAISAVIDQHTFCSTGNKVILMGLKQAGLGHAWPKSSNSTYNGSQEIWNFVSTYSKGTYASTIPSPTVLPISITISFGQTASLTASNCASGNAYLWKQGSTQIATTANFTTPVLATNTTYTAFCASGTCLSSGVDVVVTVNATSPCQNTEYLDGLITPGPFSVNQIIQAAHYINAGTQVDPLIINASNSNKLKLQAGKSITINPGLTVSNGAVFEANISPCVSIHNTIYTQGRHLYDFTGQQIIPVGLNYPTDYWQFSGTNEKVDEVDLSGANMVRMTWFQNVFEGTSHTDTDLDLMLTKFANKRIFTTLMLWDGFNGCPQNPNKLNDANGYVSWWTNPSRVTMLNNHKKHIIINLVNELGFGYSYNAGNPADVAAFTNWRNQYKTAITTIRNAGLHMPIMIDAPLCGASLSLINQAAAEIIAHDPDHNIVFSVHSYWAETNETSQIATAVSNNVPVIFGEVASKQVGADDWNTEPPTGFSQCYFGIDGTNSEHTPPTGFSYKNLLPILKTNNIGWFHWEWFNDACPGRNMSTNGNYSTLTTYGNDAVNHATYGIKNIAVKAAAGAF